MVEQISTGARLHSFHLLLYRQQEQALPVTPLRLYVRFELIFPWGETHQRE